MATPISPQKTKPDRPDGRRPLLVYLDPELIKRLKKAALDEERPAYELAEKAIEVWLGTKR
jgi:hypothetical protein